MYPARIEQYVRPQSIAEALAAISQYEAGEAMFLAGGQSAMQAMKSRMLQPQCIVDLQDIAELTGIHQDASGLHIGAMTRYVDIAASTTLGNAYAAMSDAAAHVGDRQVRNRGTIGGSVCWNYVASCTPAAVLGTGGILVLQAADGTEREINADDFFLGPLETAKNDDELLREVRWPEAPAQSGSSYKKWGLITDALPVIGVCVAVTVDAQGNCSAARVSLSGLANGCQRGAAAEALLQGSAGDQNACEAAMQALSTSVETHADMSADADFRRQLIRTIGSEVAMTAFARARA